MKKIMMIALAAMLGAPLASAETTPEDTLRIENDQVQYLNDSQEWVSVGSVEAVRNLLFQDEQSGVSISEDGELILNGEPTGYYLTKKDEDIDETTYTVEVTYMTDDGQTVKEETLDLANGTYEDAVTLPEGYSASSNTTITVAGTDGAKVILVTKDEADAKERDKEPAETASEPVSEPSASPAEEPTEELVAEVDEALNKEEPYNVEITYINYTDGATVKTEHYSIAAGIYGDYLTAPEGYVFVSENTFEVTDDEVVHKIMIVKEDEAADEVGNVSFRYIDSMGQVIAEKEAQLDPGKYDTMPGDGELAVPVLDGYRNVFPVTIDVPDGKSSFDILVSKQ